MWQRRGVGPRGQLEGRVGGASRRRFLRMAATAAAGVCGAGLWATAAQAASPVSGSQLVTLTFSPWWGNGAPWDPTAQKLSQETLDNGFNAQHAGVRAEVIPSVEGAASGQIAATLAGTGFADVFSDCCLDLPTLAAAGILVPLDPYLRRDNVDMGLWSPGRMAGLTFSGSIVGLPAYDGPEVVAYRQDLLDQFGLSYPNPDWTYLEAATVWRACARQLKGQPLYGAALDDTAMNLNCYLRGWGAATFNAGHTHCLLNTSQAVAAGDWMFGLIADKVVAPNRMDVAGLSNTQAVFSVCGGWDLFGLATQLADRFKWNILPMPTWPQGFSTMVNNDFYGIDRATKHVDAAWELLKWAMVEGAWQQFSIRTILSQPSLSTLWEEWETVVRAVAPVLRDKDIGYYREAAVNPRVVPRSTSFMRGTRPTPCLSPPSTTSSRRRSLWRRASAR